MTHPNYLLWSHPPKYLKQVITFIALMTICIQLSFGQNVSGKVLDDVGEPVIGATVIVPNTTIGTVTDIDGSFTLAVPKDTDELKVSYVGYKDFMLKLDGSNNYNVALAPDVDLLDEVVVVGYGVRKKSDLVGSIASIRGDEISSLVVGNATSALQGKMAGIQIENNGGAPGGATNVFVRGVSSLTNSFPLYVIDGTFVDNMNFLNPKDIESIEILKDASSAAIYGSRAANGVVLITTKHGNNDGRTRVSVDVRGGVETPAKMLDFLDGAQFVEYRNQLEANDGTGKILPDGLPSTDWQDLSLNPGMIGDYGVSVSGGNENSKFFLSGNYYNQEGILVGSGFTRINGRANSEFKIGRLTINQSLSLVQADLQENNWFGFEGGTAPILAESVEENEGGFEAPNADTVFFGGINKYARAVLEDNNLRSRNVLGNLNFSYELTNNLTVKLNYGLDYLNEFSKSFTPTFFMSDTDPVFNRNDQNDLSEVRGETTLTMWEPTLSYDTKLGSNSNLNVVVGFTEQKIVTKNMGIYVQGLPSNDIQVIGASAPANVQNLAGINNVSGLRSVFGRVNYDMNDRYLLQLTMRRDASSKFAEDYRVGYFPSASIGWKLHNENFFSQDRIWNRMKLRASYGILGASNIPDYAYQSVFGLASNTSVGGDLVQGYAQTTIALEDLKWEEATTFNVGADMGFWQDKLTASVDYYIKDVQDVLVGVNFPSTAGTSEPVIRNAGAIRNTGVELDLRYRQRANSDFNYEIGFNIGTFNSTVTELPNPILGPSTTEDITIVNRFIEGEAPGVFYGFEIEGVYADQAAIDNDPNLDSEDGVPNLRRDVVQPGDFIRKDLNGDGLITDEDQTILGDPNPDFIYGFNLAGNYKKLDFAVFFNGVQGNEIYNLNKFFNTVWADDNKLTTVLDGWTPENTDTDIPRATATDAAGNRAPSSFFVEDGSYLRLRTMEIGYTFNQFNNADWLGGLRVFLTGQNLLTFTKYSGYNPDVSSTNGGRANTDQGFFGNRPDVNPLLGRGLDSRAYPVARALVLGVQANF